MRATRCICFLHERAVSSRLSLNSIREELDSGILSVRLEGTVIIKLRSRIPRMTIGRILLTMLLLTSSPAFVQTIPRVRIVGTVVDASSDQPLHFANVFLSGTTIGAATDEEGRFDIVNVPLGTYELVASMVGYAMWVKEIRLTEPADMVVHIMLEPKPIQAPNIEVTAPYPHEWKKNLERFKDCLFGEGPFTKKCSILNPEVLNFKVEDKTETLTATASAPLDIVNRALGYRLCAYLIAFRFRQVSVGEYSLISLFESLEPEEEWEERKWRENRLKAYLGSRRHFFSVLCAGQPDLIKAGFTMYRLTGFHMKAEKTTIHQYETTADSVLFQCGMPDEKRLFFPHYLKVVYEKLRTKRTSWILLDHEKTVTIDRRGEPGDPDAIRTYGYWARMRLAEELPLDYEPFKH